MISPPSTATVSSRTTYADSTKDSQRYNLAWPAACKGLTCRDERLLVRSERRGHVLVELRAQFGDSRQALRLLTGSSLRGRHERSKLGVEGWHRQFSVASTNRESCLYLSVRSAQPIQSGLRSPRELQAVESWEGAERANIALYLVKVGRRSSVAGMTRRDLPEAVDVGSCVIGLHQFIILCEFVVRFDSELNRACGASSVAFAQSLTGSGHRRFGLESDLDPS